MIVYMYHTCIVHVHVNKQNEDDTKYYLEIMI